MQIYINILFLLSGLLTNWFQENMSANNNNSSNFNLRSILDRDKLTGANFLDWHRNLRIVLRQERKEHVLEDPIPALPKEGGTDTEKETVRRALEQSVDVTCLMLATMDSNLQKQFEKMDAYNIIEQLKNVFQEQAQVERFDTSKAILDTKLENGKPVGPHMLKMIGFFDNMQRLGFPYSRELATDIILHSLHDGFNTFKMNYNMNGMDKSLADLHGMLKTAEPTIRTEHKQDALMVQKGKGLKKKGKKTGPVNKGKGKAVAVVPKPGPVAVKQKAAKSPFEIICYQCNGVGYFRRDCPKYKEDLKNGNIPSTSGTKKK